MFSQDDDVARLEADLPPSCGLARASLLLHLAWALRQRDTRRALTLAEQAETLLAQSSPNAGQPFAARLLLLRAEANWLFGEAKTAAALAQQALDEFILRDDALGGADVHYLLAAMAHEAGDTGRSDEELEVSAMHARRGGDMERVDIAEATIAASAAAADVGVAQTLWGGHFYPDMPDNSMAVMACVHDFLGIAAKQLGEYGRAVAQLMLAHEKALGSGQIRRAIDVALKIGDAFTCLNEHRAALEWLQSGMQRARGAGWTGGIGACLVQTAESLHRLGRLEEAQELLREALVTLAPMASSRHYATALTHLGNLALDRGDYVNALEFFSQLQQSAEKLHSKALCGQAQALSQLGRAEEAQGAANAALVVAQGQGDVGDQIAAWMKLATIHTLHQLQAPGNIGATTPMLYFLQQAQEIALRLDGYTVPGALLDALADAHADAGNYSEAFAFARRANGARVKLHSQRATNRAIAMQVQHQTERARAEGEHHRQLATAEASRAEVLQHNSATLSYLSSIGQEITGLLDVAAVYQTLNRHVQSLLEPNFFAIYLTDPDGLGLNRVYGIEAGQMLLPKRIELSNPNVYSTRCIRENREIIVAPTPDADDLSLIPGTLQSLTCLFVPLSIGERTFGAMTIQSLTSDAFAERERLIFRTLCAYGAIALDNAQAYRQLQMAQARLVTQEKLVALGSLVAGVAHELNTPIGNSLMIASSLQEKTNTIERKMRGKNLHQADLTIFIADVQQAAVLVMRGLNSAVDMVNSFKQVAVDRTTARRRTFDLLQTSREVVATMVNQIKKFGHKIDIDIPEGIKMHSYPGPLGQVIANFINNALLHAFDGREKGHMLLWARPGMPGWLRVEFRDDGNGIAEQNMKRIFDPYFTTKTNQGGSGLGLSISYNIVTSLLHGDISVKSVFGKGATFTLNLPMTTPEQEQEPHH